MNVGDQQNQSVNTREDIHIDQMFIEPTSFQKTQPKSIPNRKNTKIPTLNLNMLKGQSKSNNNSKKTNNDISNILKKSKLYISDSDSTKGKNPYQKKMNQENDKEANYEYIMSINNRFEDEGSNKIVIEKPLNSARLEFAPIDHFKKVDHEYNITGSQKAIDFSKTSKIETGILVNEPSNENVSQEKKLNPIKSFSKNMSSMEIVGSSKTFITTDFDKEIDGMRLEDLSLDITNTSYMNRTRFEDDDIEINFGAGNILKTVDDDEDQKEVFKFSFTPRADTNIAAVNHNIILDLKKKD